EGILRVQVARIGQEQLIEARRSTVDPAQPITARVHLEERLDLAVHQELVAENAVEVEQVERQQSGRRVEHLVVQQHRYVEVADLEEVARESVALRGRVTVVQMRRDRRFAEAAVIGRQIVDRAHEYRLAIFRDEGRAGQTAVESPNRLQRQILRDAHRRR